MSQENVEIVRRFVEAASRSDFAEVMASYADDVELIIEVPHLFEGAYSGRESVAQFYVEWYGTFGGDVSFALREHRDVGDAVATRIQATARGVRSGAEVTSDYFMLYSVSQGKISRIQFYEKWAEALEAVGLEE